MTTTIQISDSVKKFLEKTKVFERESYNDVIEKMIEDNLELNERTKQELDERRKSNDFVSIKEIEKHMGL